MRKIKNDPIREDAMNTHNIAEAEFWLSEWFGAIFYYLINFGKVSFKELSAKKYLNRNVWTGWIFRMLLIIIGLGIIWKVMNYLS